jgi:ATP-binding cassette, subfamily C (CFTR/MRP), member 1
MKLFKAKNIESDLRSKKVSECIDGIKIIKFNAWELIFLKSIDLIRKKETDRNFEIFFIRATQDTISIIFPNIVSFLTIWFYALINSEPLNLEQTFTVLAIFNLIIGPVKNFFNSINNLVPLKEGMERMELLGDLPKFTNTIGTNTEV